MAAGRCAEIAQDRLANAPAKFVAIDIGAAEVNSAPHTRIVDLLGNRGEAIEGARHAEDWWKGDAHPYAVRLELAAQDSLSRARKTRMSRRIFGVRRGAEKRLPALNCPAGRGLSGGARPGSPSGAPKH